MPEYIHPHLRILIIDSDASAVEELTLLLSPVGDCTTVPDGASGFTEFCKDWNEDPYDLIFINLDLPDRPGSEVLSQLRNFESEKDLPKEEEVVIMVTSCEGELKKVLQVLKRGCNGYIVKPYIREQLYAELNKAGIGLDWSQ